MVQPTGVTVTAVPAASVPPAAANTMDVLPGAPGVSVTPAVDAFFFLAVGVAEVAKKPDGLFSVTLDGPPPPALGVKVNVASTPALAATRSPAAS